MSSSVAIFADTGNLYHCVNGRFPGRRVDYRKLLKAAQGDKNLVSAEAYGTYMNNGVRDFESSLQRIGWTTFFAEPRKAAPFDWAVGVAIRVWEVEADTIVLCSSGFEYLPLVERFKENGQDLVILACGVPRVITKFAKVIEVDESYLYAAT